eukprot:16440928-Heterocapsa_arctica.AAC.1
MEPQNLLLSRSARRRYSAGSCRHSPNRNPCSAPTCRKCSPQRSPISVMLIFSSLLLQPVLLLVEHEVRALIVQLVDCGLPFLIFSSSHVHHLLGLLLVVPHVLPSTLLMVAKVLQDVFRTPSCFASPHQVSKYRYAPTVRLPPGFPA